MKKMKQIPEEERPYEKCVRLGAEALTDAELLAVLLRTGTKGSPSVHMAEEVLNLSREKEGLLGLHSLSPVSYTHLDVYKRQGDDIVFLRKIVKGGADKSYGIQVAKLAGVPDTVIDRAKELVEELVSADITATVKNIASENRKPKAKPVVHYDEVDMEQISLFDTVKDDDVLEELKSIQVDELRPVDALNILYRLQNKLKNRW